MTSIDVRTRPDTPTHPVDPRDFVARQSVRRLRVAGVPVDTLPPPLTLEIDGYTFNLAIRDGELALAPGAAPSGTLVSMDSSAFSDLVDDAISTFWLPMMGRARLQRGDIDDFTAWEPLLRLLIDDRPVYRPGSITFTARCGEPLNLQTSFTLDDDHADIGRFLSQAGYLHLRGMFTVDEMAAISHDLDACILRAEREDGESWWARTEDGQWYPSRILQFNRKSSTLREILGSKRFRAIGTFTDDVFAPVDPSSGNAAEGLLKRPDVVEGISDVSWHKDCSPGEHSRRCCGLVVGISLSDSGAELGELSVVAGSHRANIAPLGVKGLDLPRIAVPTRAGDVTVHCSCTLHMSSPPVRGQRQVVYAGISLTKRAEDQPVERTDSARLDERASYNDAVRQKQLNGELPVQIPAE